MYKIILIMKILDQIKLIFYPHLSNIFTMDGQHEKNSFFLFKTNQHELHLQTIWLLKVNQ